MDVFDCFDKFEEELLNSRRGKARGKASKDKNPTTTLQSIHEDDVPSAHSTRGGSRSTRKTEDEMAAPPAEPRPKRTRAKKKVSAAATEPETAGPQDNGPVSPAEKTRPKRTQKAAEKEKTEEKPQEVTPPTKPQEIKISPKEECNSQPEVSSPILQKHLHKKVDKAKKDPIVELTRLDDVDAMDKTRVLGRASDMDKTVDHASVTLKKVPNMNETVVIEAANRGTMVIEKPQAHIMDATVVLDKDPKQAHLTDDNSLLTDDSDAQESNTPPKKQPPQTQPIMKKEAAKMAKEIEKRQKEYIEKQKMKHKMEDKSYTPFKTPSTPSAWRAPLSPAYMEDGFQHLNSDEDAEPVDTPVPEWCMTKPRKTQLCIQSQISSSLVYRLFSVRVHSPDLRHIFPNIKRACLKRTSSAVWGTPPCSLRPE